MKIQLIILLVLISLSTIHAQNQSVIDSIEAELKEIEKNGLEDSVKLTGYANAFAQYRYKDFRQAERIGKMVIQTGEKLNKLHLLDYWYGEMGQFYAYYGIYSLALDYYKKRKENSLKVGIENYWWAINIGNVYFAQKNYNRASKYYWEAFDGFGKTAKTNHKNSLEGKAVSTANLGLCYKQTQQFDSALTMLHNSYYYRKVVNDKFSLAFICQEISKLHIITADYDSGFIYVDKALKYDKNIQTIFKKVTPDIYNLKADIFIGKQEYHTALEILDSAVQFSVQQNNKKAKLASYRTIVEIQKKLKMHNKAIKNGKIALQLAKQAGNDRVTADLLKSLSDFYSEIENKDSAYNYQSEYISLKDIINEQSLNILLYKFEAEQSRQTVSFLEKELSLSDKEKTTYKYLILVGTSLIIVLLLFFIVIMRSSIAIRKKNIKIDHQNGKISAQLEEISQQNEEILVHNEILNEKNEQLSEAMASLKEAQTQLVQSEKMASLGVLTAGIAHEINNPVNFIYTGINSLQKDFEDLQVVINEVKKLKPGTEGLDEKLANIKELEKEYYFEDASLAIPQTIKDISTGVERTVEIINGLKFFSRMEDESFKIFNIHKTIDNALLMLKNKYKDRIIVNRNYDKDLAEISCNPGKLIQVFMNIVGNSIDAIKGSGEIQINTKSLDQSIIISIKDTGEGMDNETKEKIFDPFFTTKEVGAGTGLGMAITYGIIKEHNGDIDIKTKIGKGTEFIITFPVNK